MTLQLPEIEESIAAMEAGEFQILCDAILSAKGYEKRISPGRKLGSKKTTKGTPDTSYIRNERFVLCEYTTQATRLYKKVTDDVGKCLNPQKTGIPLDEISEILVFSSSADLTASELRDVSNVVESQTVHFEFYGPSRIADLIYHDYQWIAKDTWGIEIGSLEITDYNGFLSYYDSNAVGPGLSNAFINRKEERELEKLIASKNIVVVTGSAGVGKTKLVLEVANRFALANDYQFWCIRSCQAIAYSDVLRTISIGKNNLMFFDDVNKIGGFANILKLAAEKDVKLVVTTRNYFLGDIQNILRVNLDFSYHSRNVDAITIPPLNNEDIEKLASESFGIKNPVYLRQIKNIASGNPRLAVMACKVAVSENGLKDIQDASNLYDYYYSAVLEDCFEDESLLTVAGITAFMTPFDLQDSAIIQALLEPAGIDKEGLTAYIAELHDLEIVNLEKERAVAFVDQSLQTYLVKRVFLDKKCISLSDAIILGYSKRSNTVVSSIQSLLQVFHSNEVYDLIKDGVVTAWDFFEQNNTPLFSKFRETFSIFNPEKALLSVKHEIGAMCVEDFDVQTLSFDGAVRDLISNECLVILDNFGPGEYASEALDMILAYYVKRPKDGLQVYRAIVESFCFDPDLLIYSYEREILLVEKLAAFIRGNPSINNEILFIEVSRHLLKTEITKTRLGRGNVLEMVHGSLPLSTEATKYRSIIWNELSRIYPLNEEHHNRINHLLLKYGSECGRYGTDSQAHFQSDLLLLSDFINNNYSHEVAEHVFIAHRILKDMARVGVTVPDALFDTYKKSKYFLAIQSLEQPDLIFEESYEDREKKYDQKMEEYAKTVDKDMLTNLILMCEISESLNIDTWKMSSNLLRIINYLRQNNEALFLHACELIRDSGLYISGGHGLLAKGLIDFLGVSKAYEFLSIAPEARKDIWLFEYFCNIPEESIDQDVLKNIYYHFNNLGLLQKTPYLDIMELRHYKNIDAEFMRNISLILLEKYRENTFMLNIYFELAFSHHRFSPDFVLKEFQGVESILQDVYFTLSKQAETFDYNGAFLRAMLNSGTCTFAEALSGLSYESYGSIKLYDRNLDFIWEEDDYLIYANEIFDLICESRGKIFQCEDGLFSRISKEHEARFDLWVKQIIETHSEDIAEIKILSEATCTLPHQKRCEYISHFLDCGASVDAFKSWQLFSYIMSGSPSFVPALTQRMQFLIDIKDLLKGVERLEHRTYIVERIQQLKKSIDDHELQDFLEKFS